MGLFKNKTVKCAKCGKEFEKGAFSGAKLCVECRMSELKDKQDSFSRELAEKAFAEYYKNLPKKFQKMPADVSVMIADRDRILEKYRSDDIVTAEEFMEAYANTEVWDDDKCMEFVRRVRKALMITNNRGSFIQGGFIVSHEYDGIVADFDEVFCVALVKGAKLFTDSLNDAYLCAMFTRNPYVPAIGLAFRPVVSSGLLTFESKKNAEKMEIITKAMNVWCRNLEYPVMEVKELKKLVKKEGSVRGGAMDIDLMKALIDAAEGCGSPFYGIDSTMPEAMPYGIAYTITKYGYRSIGNLRDDLFVDKKGEKIWLSYFDRADKEAENYGLY
ncbi:MAG: hypothetical protein IJ874_02440 [Ruminococcus sp.]|nr:hypothetical protein [Ruminococcus sp.]